VQRPKRHPGRGHANTYHLHFDEKGQGATLSEPTRKSHVVTLCGANKRVKTRPEKGQKQPIKGSRRRHQPFLTILNRARDGVAARKSAPLARAEPDPEKSADLDVVEAVEAVDDAPAEAIDEPPDPPPEVSNMRTPQERAYSLYTAGNT